MTIGTTEIAILVVIAIFLFGAKRIPELARSMGLAKGEFQRAVEEGVQTSSAEQDIDRGGMTKEVSNENE